ncbi:hypothetical protein CNR22_21800 [Sphingobacteriaceae bacterium]|nr:hypothetical protein CNR22_21800 [Sphingobacteriaceae bacterium]
MKKLLFLILFVTTSFIKSQTTINTCAGTAVILTAPNPQNLTTPTYSMNPGGLNSSTGTWTVNPASTTNYTLFTNGQNASNTNTTTSVVITISVQAQPQTAPTVTSSTCTNSLQAFHLGLTFTSTLIPTYTVNWATIPNNVYSSTQTNASGTFVAGLYQATITAAGGCSTTASFSIGSPIMPVIISFPPSNQPNFVINCYTPTLTVNMNPSTYNYSWMKTNSSTVTGSVISFNASSIGNWTVIATDPITGCNAQQTFNVSQNTTTPTSSLSPLFQNITCNLSSVTSVSAFANPSLNVLHQFISPLAGTFSSPSYSTIYVPGAPGTYTHFLTNTISGCSTFKTFTVVSNNGFPSFTATSPQNFTLGCSSKSFAIVSLINGITSPSGGPVSYTILPPGSSSSSLPSGSLGPVSFFSITIPGTYTFITRDNTSFCESRVPITILQNTTSPSVYSVSPSGTITCSITQIKLEGISSTNHVGYSWVFPNSVVNSNTINVTSISSIPSNTLVNNYTLTMQDSSNLCITKQVVPVFQNIFPPKAIIGSSITALTCNNPSIMLLNYSQSTIPPQTGFPNYMFVMATLWKGPAPQLPLQNSTGYTAFVPGIYTLTALDLNNGCTSKTITTVMDNRIYPNVVTPATFSFLPCPGIVTISPLIIGSTSGLTYSWTTPPNASVSISGANLTTNYPGPYTVVVTNFLTGCSASVMIPVYACVGVNESYNGSKKINISPNPGYGVFKLNFEADLSSRYSVEIFNALGQLIKSESVSGNNHIISIENEETGIYSVRLFQNNRIYAVTKLVKQ